MAEIPRFEAKAQRGRTPMVPTDGGAVAALSTLASVSNQLATRLGRMADEATVRESREQAQAETLALPMPGVEFVHDGKSAATTPAKSVPGNAGEYKQYLMQTHGLSDFRAAAIVGHLVQESGLRPTGAVGDAGTAFGLAQWRHDRFDNLKRFAASKGKSWEDDRVQLDFIMHEMATTEATAGRAFAAAGTLEEATAAFMSFERPAGWTPKNPRGGHAWSQRLANAQAVLGGGGGVRAPAPSGAPAAPSGGIKVLLTGAAGAVPQKKAGTLAGDAYNSAAIEIHVNRLDTAMRGQMDALALQHEGDPAGLGQALDALRDGYVADLPPAGAALIDRSFQTQKLSLQRQAARQFNDRLEQSNRAAFEENISARHTNAMRLAARAGLDETADAALGAELAGLQEQIDASPLDPLEKSRKKRDVAQDMWSARLLASFDAIEDPRTRAKFAELLDSEWQAGEGVAGRLDAKSYEAVRNEVARRLQADDTKARQRSAALDKAVDGQIGLLKKGWPVPATERARLREEIASTGDEALAANLDFLDSLAGWQSVHVAARPEAVAAQIETLRARIAADGATPAALATLDVMEGLQKAMDTGLKTDPIGWAARAGVIEPTPIDFSDAGTLSATLSARTSEAHAVATHFGVEPRFFTPAEAAGLSKMLKTTPLALPSLVSGLSAGLGDDTPTALAELAPDAPVLAHVAGLVHATGDQRVAVEVAEALELRRVPGYKSALPAPAKLQTAAAAALGGALALLPRTGPQALETAAALFEARVFQRGLDLSGFDREDDPAREAFAAALDEVLGARVIGGVKHGGLAEVNGHTTIAPPDMPAEAMQDLLDGLAADDLLFQGGLGTANGLAITPSQLRRGRLVMTSPGRYRVALGDVEAGDPRWAPAATGGYFEIDMAMLAKSQKDRGRAVISGPGAGRAWDEQFR
jgi:hypothetical protein